MSKIEDTVWKRARERCEYCQLPAGVHPSVFHVDHITPRCHGGKTSLENLALACLHCNAHKGTNLTGIDPQTNRVTRLFDPRQDRWPEHFRWREAILVGLTDVGRTTVRVLAINRPDFVEARRSLLQEGLFPPP